MNADRLVIDDREWLAEVVQHWPDGGPSDRPAALDVLFYDLEDHDQWVGNAWVPYDAADLSRDGLRRLFREADARSWRDSSDRYWRIRVFRPGTLGPRHTGDRPPDGIVSFHPRDSSGSAAFSRVVAELPPIGLLSDDELERLQSIDAGDEAARPTSESGPLATERRTQ